MQKLLRRRTHPLCLSWGLAARGSPSLGSTNSAGDVEGAEGCRRVSKKIMPLHSPQVAKYWLRINGKEKELLRRIETASTKLGEPKGTKRRRAEEKAGLPRAQSPIPSRDRSKLTKSVQSDWRCLQSEHRNPICLIFMYTPHPEISMKKIR